MGSEDALCVATRRHITLQPHAATKPLDSPNSRVIRPVDPPQLVAGRARGDDKLMGTTMRRQPRHAQLKKQRDVGENVPRSSAATCETASSWVG
jgi:hypothetical protein